MMVPTMLISETSLDTLVAEIKKEKVAEDLKSLASKLRCEDVEIGPKRIYRFLGLCGFSFNKVDFGWGNPIAAAAAFRSLGNNSFMLLDGVDGARVE
ncbi:hypothetical protein L1987_39616 [Smallanthus sonchifolius]|uniref:Uncharacterized protein n=1 Tax=Smallanthus sonchifolius TaxID=185202 RepID=A0ACB9HLX9_9ASTR|nr:hypothetical protein L1987_39616 [Smallanthus sonchifolius]